MNTFFTADLHFGHKTILEYTLRPFDSVEAMDAALIANYNSLVGRKDLVYILGDFAWKNHARYVHALNGKKILVKGTHEKMNQQALAQFTRVYDFGADIKIEGQPITISHNPQKSWAKSMHGSWNLHGHSHGRSIELPHVLACDVGVDAWEYFPVPFEVVKEKMDAKMEAFKNRELSSREELDARVRALTESNMKYFSAWKRSQG